ncbi:NAD(P)-binding protein [Flammula alnicola]|nr:NAD(P)-binding protein [Flammula alnicola]
MSSSKVYFIAGATRGIGLALVNELVSKHAEAMVFAGARDPSKATSLQELASKFPGKIEIVKFVSGDVEGNQFVAKKINEKYGHVDVVVANAAISGYMGPASETPVEAFREHFEVNVTGVLVLFQAVYELLKASVSPKFIPIGSGAGSLTAHMNGTLGCTAYGVSKAAVNYMSRKIHFENEWLTCFPLSPGRVDTDMAKENLALDKSGTLASVKHGRVTPAVAGTALVNIIDGSTREKDGGEFINVDGTKIPW